MKIKQWLHADYLPVPLIALMVLTRFHHFGDALHLPDASLAVFFFAGFYRNKVFLAFLMAIAVLIDYVAIAKGTSDFCISAAYIFLAPAYAAMWLAGQHCAKYKAQNLSNLASSMFLLALATSVAFAISNGSFYLMSGRIEAFSWPHFTSQFARYYPSYMLSTLGYGLAGLGIIRLVKVLPGLLLKGKTV